jgi:hypothetical protein
MLAVEAHRSANFLASAGNLIESVLVEMERGAPAALAGISELVRAGGALRIQASVSRAGLVESSLWLVAPNGRAIEIAQLHALNPDDIAAHLKVLLHA